MFHPRFSIVTPCYNVDKYLSDCVKSILCQKVSDWELLLIDDGSTDATPQLCDKYALQDPRIKVIHQKNAGVSAARNHGLNEAKGEWVVFIDSDDWFTEGAFNIYEDEINDGDSDLYIFNRYTCNDGKVLPINHLQPNRLIREGREKKFFLIDMLFPYYDKKKNGVVTGGIRGVNCKLYRRSLIEKHHIRFEDSVKIAEDAMFNFDVMIHAHSVTMVDKMVGYYRICETSVMHRFTPDIDEINNQALAGFRKRLSSLWITDVEFRIAWTGLVAECVFRALKLKYLNSSNDNPRNLREQEFKRWYYQELVQKGLDADLIKWLPTGKRQMMNYLAKENVGGFFDSLYLNDISESKEEDLAKVAIVVPIYKVPEKLLRQCIESCINQTLKEIEIILVDDGSPDNCGKICDEFATIDNRIKVIHKTNGGLAAARNTGQDAVTAESMMFLDGDDYLEAECCAHCYKILKEKNVELVMFDQKMEYDNSTKICYSMKDNPQGLLLNQYEDENGLYFCDKECKKLQVRVLNFNGRIAMAFQKLILTDFIRKNNIRHVDELRQGMEGFVFNIQLYNYVNRVYYLPEPYYHYIYNTQSITHKPSEMNYNLCVKCLEWINDYIDKCENKDRLKRELLYRALFLIVNAAISCFFSPLLDIKFRSRKEKLKEYLARPLLNLAMSNGNRERLDSQRKIVLWLIDHHVWSLLYFLGCMRKRQLDKR